MTVLVHAVFAVETDTFLKALAERQSEFRDFAGIARKSGCIHHHFGIDPDNNVITVDDEWLNADAFHHFFADPKLQAFLSSAGADTYSEPAVSIVKALDSPDQF